MFGCGICEEYKNKKEANVARHIRAKHDEISEEEIQNNIDELGQQVEKKFISSEKAPFQTAETEDFERMDDLQYLDRLVWEVTGMSPRKRGFVISRMKNKLDDIDELVRLLTLERVPKGNIQEILKDWGIFKEVDISQKIERIEDPEKGKEGPKEMLRDLEEEEIEDLSRMKRLADLKKLRTYIDRPKEEKPKEDMGKVPYVVDGVTIQVTPQELLAWKQWEKREEEKTTKKEEPAPAAPEAKTEEKKEVMVSIPLGDKTVEVPKDVVPYILMMNQPKQTSAEDIAKAVKDATQDTKPKETITKEDLENTVIGAIEAHTKDETLKTLIDELKKKDGLVERLIEKANKPSGEGYQSDDARLLHDGLNIIGDKVDKAGNRIHGTIKDLMGRTPPGKVSEGAGDDLIDRLPDNLVEE